MKKTTGLLSPGEIIVEISRDLSTAQGGLALHSLRRYRGFIFEIAGSFGLTLLGI